MTRRVRRYVRVSGRVQGVGFRYFTQRVATHLGLTGYVRNLASGEVEMEAEGPVEALDDFEHRIRQGPPAPASITPS